MPAKRSPGDILHSAPSQTFVLQHRLDAQNHRGMLGVMSEYCTRVGMFYKKKHFIKPDIAFDSFQSCVKIELDLMLYH